MHLAYVMPLQKAAWIDLPKTASRAVLKVLGQYGPLENTSSIPPEVETVFTIGRNPYTRCLSLWWSTAMQPGDRYGLKAFGTNPAEFIRNMAKAPKKKLDLYFTQAQLLGKYTGSVPLTRLRYENLEQDLRSLPFINDDQEVPIVNRKENGRPPADYSPEFIEAVNYWCAEDFEMLQYIMLEPRRV
jgi:hypothetical protein